MEVEAVYVGIDVSKARLDVAVWPGAERFSVGNDPRGIAELVEKVAALTPAGGGARGHRRAGNVGGQ